MGKEFDFSGYTRAEMVKNLLTDGIFSKQDQALLDGARTTVIALEEKERREKAEKTAAAKGVPKAGPGAAGGEGAPP